MITLWRTSSNINFKFTTQAQCWPANIQIYGHIRSTAVAPTETIISFIMSPFKTLCVCARVRTHVRALYPTLFSPLWLLDARKCISELWAASCKRAKENNEKRCRNSCCSCSLIKTVIYCFLRCELVFIICFLLNFLSYRSNCMQERGLIQGNETISNETENDRAKEHRNVAGFKMCWLEAWLWCVVISRVGKKQRPPLMPMRLKHWTKENTQWIFT